MAIEPFLTAIALALGALAALTDARSGRIPNALTLPVLVLAPCFVALTAGPTALALTLAGALACALVPLVLFHKGAMGGGDVKLLAALGALLGPTRGLEVELVAVALVCGLALARWAWSERLGAALTALSRAALGRAHDTSVLQTEVRFAPPLFVALVVVVLT